MSAEAPRTGISRKMTPIRRADGEAFTRQDIQYDFLSAVFSDDSRAFSDAQGHDQALPHLTFAELYVKCLIHSSKCSKVLRDKMLESGPFALDFAKLALLANVGRINSTQAFFPEMRTALRTYHPIPSLQRTEGSLLDAPRVKSCLKGCSLPGEAENNMPNSLEAILTKARNGEKPSTNVVNLIFVLANHSSEAAVRHFPEALRLDFLDLFLPVSVPSLMRARTFLWLMYHYLEGVAENPFDDTWSQANLGKSPYIYQVDHNSLASENVDTLAEITWGQKMAARRATFLDKQMDLELRSKELLPAGKDKSEVRSVNVKESRSTQPSRRNAISGRKDDFRSRASYEAPDPSATKIDSFQNSMLLYAWETGIQRDPMMDSDGEDADITCKLDYERRLFILNRIRGREPTPNLYDQME